MEQITRIHIRERSIGDKIMLDQLKSTKEFAMTLESYLNHIGYKALAGELKLFINKQNNVPADDLDQFKNLLLKILNIAGDDLEGYIKENISMVIGAINKAFLAANNKLKEY